MVTVDILERAMDLLATGDTAGRDPRECVGLVQRHVNVLRTSEPDAVADIERQLAGLTRATFPDALRRVIAGMRFDVMDGLTDKAEWTDDQRAAWDAYKGACEALRAILTECDKAMTVDECNRLEGRWRQYDAVAKAAWQRLVTRGLGWHPNQDQDVEVPHTTAP